MLPQFVVSGTKVSRTKVVNPNRGIRENQFVPCLRRGIFFSLGMVPSRDANRRALSRSMRALSASRMSAVFSATPVNSWAVRTRSSSSATVVLIALIIASDDVICRACRHRSVRDIRVSRRRTLLSVNFGFDSDSIDLDQPQEQRRRTRVSAPHKICRHGDPRRDRCGSMKFHTEYLTLHTKTKRAYIHLTRS